MIDNRDRDARIEAAYRRGVHQAIHAIDKFIHDNLELDPASVLDVAQSVARTFRFDKQEHNLLLDELLKVVAEKAR